MHAALDLRRPAVLLAWIASAAYLELTACSSADDELARFITDIKRQSVGRVEPLPKVKPYESFLYKDSDLRSPFMPSSPGSGTGLPESNREFFEQYSFDTLKIVGTLRLGGQIDGLVETPCLSRDSS